MNKSVSIILKVCNHCNIKCKHCYEEGNVCLENKEIMSLDTLERIFLLAQTEYDKITYVWFGGEPLICGLDYFKKAIALQKKHSKGKQIKNTIQTNGILMTEEFLDFLLQEKFNISISYDAQYNDILRQKSEKTLETIKLIREKGASCGILSTIHSKNYDKQIEMYEYIKELGCPLKFNPIFPGGSALRNKVYLLDVEKYCSETIRFFKYWCNDSNPLNVANFIHFLQPILNSPHRNCSFGKCFYKWIDIEPNGDILPCSRFDSRKYVICSLDEIDSFEDVFEKVKYSEIVEKAIKRRLNCRENCPIYQYCNGGCNSAASNETGLENSGFQQCKINKIIIPEIVKIIENIKKEDIKNPILKRLLLSKLPLD